MTYVQENYRVPQQSFTNEDNCFLPRCSTPIFNSLPVCRTRKKTGIKKVEKSVGYCEWKNCLERKKNSKNFKLRGSEAILQSWDSNNCTTIISGYFKPELPHRISEETVVRPAPVHHQMWVPISYPGFLTPATDASYYHQNPVWYKMLFLQEQQRQQQLHQHQHFKSVPVIGATGGAAFFNMLNTVHHHSNLQYGVHHSHDYNCCIAKAQMMQCSTNYNNTSMIQQQIINMGHYYHPHNYPAQYFTYSSETEIATNYLNVPIYEGNGFPVMMI